MSKVFTLFLMLAVSALQAQIVWTGAIDSDWDNAMNWLPMSVPTATDDVTIIGPFINEPVLSTNASANNLNMSLSTLELNSLTLNVAGTLTSNTGAVINSGAVVAGNFSVLNTTFTDISLEKTGAGTGNIGSTTVFNGTTVITQSGSAALRISHNAASNVTFNGPTTLNRDGSANLVIGNNGTTTFEDVVTINQNTGNCVISNSMTSSVIFNDVTNVNLTTGTINFTNRGSVTFNADLYLNRGAGGGVNFGQSGGVTTLLGGALKTTGFSGGAIDITNFTQVDPLANDAFSPNNFTTLDCDFAGSMTITANNTTLTNSGFQSENMFSGQNTFFSGCSFNGISGATTVTKTGGGGLSNWDGGNAFFGDFFYYRNGGNGVVFLANAAGNTFYGNATIENNRAAGSLNLMSGAGATSTFFGDILTGTGANPVTFTPGIMEIAGGAAQQITAPSIVTLTELIMNSPGGTFDLITPVQINTQLTLTDGIINTTSTNLLTLLDNTTVTGGSDASHVDGPLEKIGDESPFTFPAGNGGFYAPLTITGASLAADSYTAQYFKDNAENAGYSLSSLGAGIDHVSNAEYWTLEAGVGSTGVNVTIGWDARSGGVTDPTTLQLVQWDGAQWADVGDNSTVTGDMNSGSISTTVGPDLTTMGIFTLSSSVAFPSNPLPIELLYFKATGIEKTVKLEWATASEHNNAFFTVERSADGRNFSAVHQMPGAGTSNQTLYYEDFDRSPLSGTSYYRLKQTDFDGAETASPVVSINFTNEDKPISLFPNPANTSLQVAWSTEASEDLIRLVNTRGQIVNTAQRQESGIWSFDVSFLSDGIYFLQIQTNNSQVVEKVIVRH